MRKERRGDEEPERDGNAIENEMAALKGKVDIFIATQFFHLISYPGQILAIKKRRRAIESQDYRSRVPAKAAAGARVREAVGDDVLSVPGVMGGALATGGGTDGDEVED